MGFGWWIFQIICWSPSSSTWGFCALCLSSSALAEEIKITFFLFFGNDQAVGVSVCEVFMSYRRYSGSSWSSIIISSSSFACLANLLFSAEIYDFWIIIKFEKLQIWKTANLKKTSVARLDRLLPTWWGVAFAVVAWRHPIHHGSWSRWVLVLDCRVRVHSPRCGPGFPNFVQNLKIREYSKCWYFQCKSFTQPRPTTLTRTSAP